MAGHGPRRGMLGACGSSGELGKSGGARSRSESGHGHWMSLTGQVVLISGTDGPRQDIDYDPLKNAEPQNNATPAPRSLNFLPHEVH